MTEGAGMTRRSRLLAAMGLASVATTPWSPPQAFAAAEPAPDIDVAGSQDPSPEELQDPIASSTTTTPPTTTPPSSTTTTAPVQTTVPPSSTTVPEDVPVDPEPLVDPIDPDRRPTPMPAEGVELGYGIGRPAEELVDWNDEVDASARAFASRMTTHIVTVRLAGDEEWRDKFGGDWDNRATDAIERADNDTFSKFGIDMNAHTWVNWDSDDGATPCALVTDLRDDIARGGADILLGYSKQGYAGGPGCAAGASTKTSTFRHAVIMNSDWNWQITQHEFSHLIGVVDRYISSAGDNPAHPDDVMEDPYGDPGVWCGPSGTNDAGIMASYAGRFD